ncbi:MAG: hypothetical protein ACRC1H_03035, partial [Caldilineaceae bacterium]
MQAETTLAATRRAKRESTTALPAAVRVARQEWIFPLLTALVLLAVTTIPYLWAWFNAPADKVVMGILVNVPDHM